MSDERNDASFGADGFEDMSGETMLPEHRDNPLVAPLGAPMSTRAIFKWMMRQPRFSPSERTLKPHLRRYCTLRLVGWVEPIGRQVKLVDRLHQAIRSGYVGRSPAKRLHLAKMLDAADRVEKGKLETSLEPLGTTAACFGVAGAPGLGKTLTMRLGLQAIPSVVAPDVPYFCTQITSVFVQCPTSGGITQFCIDTLAAMDKLIGTNYAKQYGSGKKYDLELQLQVKVQLHALGVLVLDEVQHLLQAGLDRKKIVNFLVILTNRCCVPVVLVGTMAALEILQQDFREARRAIGIGVACWEPMTRGEDWDDLVDAMWKFQWTVSPTVMDEEIREVLYDECQGIPDLLVKLFILCQMRAISRSEALGPRPAGRPCLIETKVDGETEEQADARKRLAEVMNETLTPGLIRDVAREDFKIVAPMMRALRLGNRAALAEYPDLQPLQDHFDRQVEKAVAQSMKDVRQQVIAEEKASERAAAQPDDPGEQVRLLLVRRGLNETTADRIVTEVRDMHPSEDILEMMVTAASLARSFEQSNPAATARRARKQAKAEAAKRPVLDLKGDLRTIVAQGVDGGLAAYTALLAANSVKSMEMAVAR